MKFSIKTRKRFGMLVAFCVVGASISGCSAGATASTPAASAGGVPTKTIGWVDATLDGGFDQRIHDTAEAAAAKLGWTINTVDTAGDPTKAASGITNLLNQRVDAIIMSSIEPSTVRAGLVKAQQSNIPVIMVGGDVDGSLNSELGLTFMGADSSLLAKPVADAMISDLKPGDDVGVLTSSQLISGPRRSDVFKQELPAAGINVVGVLDTGFDFQSALANANALIAQNPNLKAIVPVFDLWTAACVQAVKASGKDIKVYPFEADPTNVQQMRDNPDIIPALVDGNLLESPLIAMDQLLKFFVAKQAIDPKAADGVYKLQSLRLDDVNRLVPGSQNGPVSIDDALAPYLAKWKASYGL
ncbi:MAG: D-ribose transporter substrate-binding protein [Subtercola sp.]|nr:D-ribose transporter substrate-binding protein [Subtercola sp.]